MRLRIGVLILMALTASPALAQGFDVVVPGLGHVTSKLGFAPGVDDNCVPQGQFPPGNVSTPFWIWAVTNFSAPLARDVTVRREIRTIHPNGFVEPDVDPAGVLGHGWADVCMKKQINRVEQFGDYRYQFFYNNVEIGRLTLTVTQR